jgi:hypothetical protein
MHFEALVYAKNHRRNSERGGLGQTLYRYRQQLHRYYSRPRSPASFRRGGATWGEALRVGVSMISRGEVGLIVAGVGVTAGVIETDVFRW